MNLSEKQYSKDIKLLLEELMCKPKNFDVNSLSIKERQTLEYCKNNIDEILREKTILLFSLLINKEYSMGVSIYENALIDIASRKKRWVDLILNDPDKFGRSNMFQWTKQSFPNYLLELPSSVTGFLFSESQINSIRELKSIDDEDRLITMFPKTYKYISLLKEKFNPPKN